MQIIILHGAPGCGKTTVSAKLHEHYKSPWFEFGWIPEFRLKNPHTEIPYAEEERMTFETLMLVAKNYVKHGFENVILSDLNDRFIPELPEWLGGIDYALVTLYSDDEEAQKTRILTRDNGNEYRDREAALEINRSIKARALMPREYRVGVTGHTVEDVVARVIGITGAGGTE